MEWEPTALLTGLWLELRSSSSKPLIIWILPGWGLGKDQALEARRVTTCFLLPQGTQFGQWDTAGFENEEQKLKFLKLMGGFKNLPPSFSRPSPTVARPSMALSKKAADTLQRNLQQDYDRALSWKYSRGAGLGFSTAPAKVFYIDRNASKSIKFED